MRWVCQGRPHRCCSSYWSPFPCTCCERWPHCSQPAGRAGSRDKKHVTIFDCIHLRSHFSANLLWYPPKNKLHDIVTTDLYVEVTVITLDQDDEFSQVGIACGGQRRRLYRWTGIHWTGWHQHTLMDGRKYIFRAVRESEALINFELVSFLFSCLTISPSSGRTPPNNAGRSSNNMAVILL